MVVDLKNSLGRSVTDHESVSIKLENVFSSGLAELL